MRLSAFQTGNRTERVRYVRRPPLALERLTETSGGQLAPGPHWVPTASSSTNASSCASPPASISPAPRRSSAPGSYSPMRHWGVTEGTESRRGRSRRAGPHGPNGAMGVDRGGVGRTDAAPGERDRAAPRRPAAHRGVGTARGSRCRRWGEPPAKNGYRVPVLEAVVRRTILAAGPNVDRRAPGPRGPDRVRPPAVERGDECQFSVRRAVSRATRLNCCTNTESSSRRHASPISVLNVCGRSGR